MTLTFNVNKQKIERTDENAVVADSRNYLYAQFSFSEEWQGTISANFKKNNSVYTALLDSENLCLVPSEVISEGIFSVSCFCGDRITANKAYVTVLPSGFEEGVPPLPSEDVYSAVITKIDEMAVSTNELINAYVNGTIGRGSFTAGNHIEIYDGEISATDYITPVSVNSNTGIASIVKAEGIYQLCKQTYINIMGERVYLQKGSIIARSDGLSGDYNIFILGSTGGGLGYLYRKSGACENVTKLSDLIGINEYVVGSSAHIYSLSEQIVGTWINGKPLYEKTYIINHPTISSEGFNIFNIDTIPGYEMQNTMCISGYIKMVSTTSGNKTYIPLGSSGGSSGMYAYLSSVWQDINNGGVLKSRFYLPAVTYDGRYAVIDEICLTVRYSKSTDAAKS